MKSLVSASRVVVAFLFAVVVIGPRVADAADEKKPEKAKEKITYEKHIKPIFKVKCLGCHNPSKKIGGLDMTSYSAMRVGGSSGEEVEPGDPDSSFLWLLVNHESKPFMPPKSDKLEKPILDLIKAWIEGGALENSGSKFVRKKPKFDFSLKEVPTGKPEVPPMPGRLGLQPVVKTELTTAISALATNPWSSIAAVAGQQQILLYNTQSLQLVGVLPFPEGIPHVLNFSRNGSLLMAGGGRGAYQGRVVVFDVKTGKRLFEVGDETDTILGADISSDQSLIALGSSSKVVRVYSVPDGELVYEIPKKHTDWIYCAAFSPDGVLLATADRAGGIFVWEAETGRPYLTLRAHGGAVNGLSWRADSNILASCGNDSTIRLWEMENGGQVKNWGAHGGGAQSVEFCRDGNLVSCGRDRVTKLWNQGGGQIRAFPAFGDFALQVTYCDETKRVIAGDVTGLVRVWNAADAKPLGELSANPPKIEQRLTTATAALTAKNAENAKAVETAKAAKAATDKVKADLAAAQKNMTDAKARLQTATNTAKTTKPVITKVTAEQQAATKVVAALTPVVPLLKETLAKGQATAAKAAGDKEIAAAVAQIKTLLDKRSVTLTTSQKTATDKAAELKKAQATLAAAETQVKDETAKIATYTKQVADLTAAMKTADQKAAEAQKAAAATTQAVQSAQSDVNRWKEEIVFVGKLTVLSEREAQFDTLELAALEAEDELKQKNAELTKRNAAVTAAQAQAKVSADAVAKSKAAVAQATATHKKYTETATALTAAIPLLNEALKKGQEALSKAPKDKELIAATTALKTLIDKKNVELTNTKKSVTEAATALAKAKQQQTATEKQATAATAAVAAAQKQVADYVPTVKPVEAKSVEARKAADAAKQTVDAAQKDVDQLRAKSA